MSLFIATARLLGNVQGVVVQANRQAFSAKGNDFFKKEGTAFNGNLIVEFDKPNSGDRTEITELTDVLRIDGNREIYKESSITSLLRKITQNNSGVAVTNERITANQEIRVTYGESNDHELNHFDDYSISIDRVSGAFKEVFLQGGIGKKKTDSFRVETNGMCKKAEQKFQSMT